jgi:hypothetical protein
MTPTSSRHLFRIGRAACGLGLFATKPIKKRQFIARYWGRRIPTETADERNNRYMFEVSSRWTIDGSTRRNLARYINHSCRPNAEPFIHAGIIRIRAIKEIEPGEEITYHYGRDYFDTFIKPNCKCKACRDKRRRLRAAKKNGSAKNGKTNGNGKAASEKTGKKRGVTRKRRN